MDILKFICHRKPERSFKYKDKYFPVCARCTGFYLGILVSFPIVFFLLKYLQGIDLFILGITLLIPMFLDGITQFYKFRESNNILRLITGLIGGFGVTLLIFKIFLNLSYLL